MDDLTFVRRVRRAIHRRPELQHDEWRTANLVERILVRLGLEPFRPASTSVATIVGPCGMPGIGFRADLDALATPEVTGAEYASRNPGVMHACGYDGHAAGLLALARRLVAGPAFLAAPTGRDDDGDGRMPWTGSHLLPWCALPDVGEAVGGHPCIPARTVRFPGS